MKLVGSLDERCAKKHSSISRSTMAFILSGQLSGCAEDAQACGPTLERESHGGTSEDNKRHHACLNTTTTASSAAPPPRPRSPTSRHRAHALTATAAAAR